MNHEQLTSLLQDLVRIPSVNPAGDPGTDARNTGEARMVEYLAEVFRKLALDVEVHEVEPGRANLIGKFASRGGKRAVVFAPHTDTVSVAGMTIDPFGGGVRDGKLFGRGASDTKGSIACMLAALANVVRQKEFREGDLDVYFCALMGEENGNDGVRALMRRGFKADFAIAGEPTGCRIVHTHKGALWFKLATRGRSIHGSMPERGENAIGKMVPVVQYLLGEYTQQLNRARHPVLGAATVNVSVIRGGAQTNIVPDFCEIHVDRRTLPGENHAAILDELRQRFASLPVEIKVLSDTVALYTEPGNPFVQQLAAATGDATTALVGAPWFSDAGIFAQHGIPAVAFGPGHSAQAHTADEFIELAEVFRAAEILDRWLGSGSGARC